MESEIPGLDIQRAALTVPSVQESLGWFHIAFFPQSSFDTNRQLIQSLKNACRTFYCSFSPLLLSALQG